MNPVLDIIWSATAWLFSVVSVVVFCWAWFWPGGGFAATDGDKLLMVLSAVFAGVGATFILCRVTSNRGW